MKRILILLLLVALLLPLVSCGKKKAKQTDVDEKPLSCTVLLTPFNGNVSLQNEQVKAYLADDVFSATDYAEGKEEFSRPAPIVLRWNVDFQAGKNNLRYFVLRIWTKPDKSDERAFIIGREEREYAFYNAYAGQEYSWNVTAYGADGVTVASAVNTFRTEDQVPRDLYVDGVTNVRDLGGRVTEDGGRVRQGLLFRGAKLDWKGIKMISDEGIKTMRQTLGIKTELDLRTDNESGAITESFLGADVNYVRRTLSGGFAPDATLRGNLKKVFALLADENNYPIFFHCAAGADRTGLVAWFVNGLLGVSEDDLWRDYLLTNFGDVGGSRDKSFIDSKYVKTLKNATGASYAQKVYNYLKDTAGVPGEQLDAVIRIMKIQPGAAAESNAMPAIPAGHTHVPESDDTLISEATCSYPGIRVKYCSVCGEFIGDTVAEIPIDPDGHRADWTVTRQPTVTDQADGSRNGTCVLCGKYVEQTTRFSPSILVCTDQIGGTYVPDRVSFADLMRGAHFYPTTSAAAGNDLLIEYSVFYNQTMRNLDTEKCDPYATTRINAEPVVYWSPTADISGSWCKYAGGFEGTEENFVIPVSDGTVTTPTKMSEKDGGYADYPNIGGANQNSPAYGWHRVSIRIHQELTNATALMQDTTAGKTKATYLLTLTVYFDGVAAYKLKTNESETPLHKKANLLFTAVSDGKGGIVYTDIAADRYVIPFQLDDTTAKSGQTAYVAIADVSVSCGTDFVQSVEKLALPTASTLTVAPDQNLFAPIYYKQK